MIELALDGPLVDAAPAGWPDAPDLAVLWFAHDGVPLAVAAPRARFARASGVRVHGDGRAEVRSAATGAWMDAADLGFEVWV